MINENNNIFPKEICMYTREQVAELFYTNKDFITTLCELEILRPIKIGKRYMFSYASLVDFEKMFRGQDLSNGYKALEAKKIVDAKIETQL